MGYCTCTYIHWRTFRKSGKIASWESARGDDSSVKCTIPGVWLEKIYETKGYPTYLYSVHLGEFIVNPSDKKYLPWLRQ